MLCLIIDIEINTCSAGPRIFRNIRSILYLTLLGIPWHTYARHSLEFTVRASASILSIPTLSAITIFISLKIMLNSKPAKKISTTRSTHKIYKLTE